MRKFPLLLALFLACPVVAADPAIRFPTVVQPVPKPDPASVPRLTANLLYVVDSDVPILVLASPLGRVAIAEDAGPLKIRGVFIDGQGKFETRTFKGKQVFTIEAATTGRVELLVVPVGSTRPEEVMRRTIDVEAGQGPRPPPDPPVPPPDPLLQAVQAAYSAQTSTTKATDRDKLAAVYRAVEKQLGSLDTTGNLFTVLRGATELEIEGRLKPIRSLFGGELQKVLPLDDVALTETDRKAVGGLLLRFVAVLEQVK